ncbi:SNRPE [Lepeophtheirus salmonis]|uniref:SNRPE n=1 Tax=Lepeophtheirus salmonis TaxID=72036 RepID=A0A7R8CVG9_LEPSM|nr:SNRPE [Lepeophtheirus salmonis]CAF2944702.1 SNRPE [Lepeophtheirus salmonis]
MDSLSNVYPEEEINSKQQTKGKKKKEAKKRRDAKENGVIQNGLSRSKSKSAEGDGTAHQPYLQISSKQNTSLSVALREHAAEVHVKRGTTKNVGTIMLKGDNITLIQSKEVPVAVPAATASSS